eukprot:gene15659-6945_t
MAKFIPLILCLSAMISVNGHVYKGEKIDDNNEVYEEENEASGDAMAKRALRWTVTEEIQHEDMKGPWGVWGPMDFCNDGKFATGFFLRAEKEQGAGDDTGANAVCLQCGDKEVCSKEGKWGEWSDEISCPTGSFISGWRQNVEDKQGRGVQKDDTALNNVEYRCRDKNTWEGTGNIKTNAKEWGKWSRLVECSRGQFICGIKTRVEKPGGDDTALNDIKHNCCKPLLKKEKAKM